MHYKINDESENNRFVIKMSGPFTLQSHAALLKELVSHPNWKKGLDLLVDGREVSLEYFEAEQIKIAATSVVHFGDFIGECRHAIICPDEGFTKVSMFTFFADEEVGWTSRLFSSDEYAEAVSWLDDNRPKRRATGL